MGADVDALIVIVPLSALPFSSCYSRRPGESIGTVGDERTHGSSRYHVELVSR